MRKKQREKGSEGSYAPTYAVRITRIFHRGYFEGHCCKRQCWCSGCLSGFRQGPCKARIAFKGMSGQMGIDVHRRNIRGSQIGTTNMFTRKDFQRNGKMQNGSKDKSMNENSSHEICEFHGNPKKTA